MKNKKYHKGILKSKRKKKNSFLDFDFIVSFRNIIVRQIEKSREKIAEIIKLAGREITIFSKTKYPFSFKPFLLGQGLVVFAFIFFSVFSLTRFFQPQPQISESQIIKNFTVKQTSAIIAGQPIKWTMIVNRSQIGEEQSFVSLPKEAKNIRVKVITKAESEILLAKDVSQNSVQLTTGERKKLASTSSRHSFFVASILSRVSKFFLASAENAVDNIVESITQEVTVTEDVKLVDLSEEKEIKEEIKEEEKQEKQEEKTEEIIQPESEVEITEPIEETEPVVEEVIEVVETVSQSDQEITTTSDIVPEVVEEQPVEEEFVKVDYETPAPEIIEEETKTGKLVTISSEDNCEKLKPVISFITNSKNIIASITGAISNQSKRASLFLGNLEESVNQAIGVVTEEIIPETSEVIGVSETPILKIEETVSPSDQEITARSDLAQTATEVVEEEPTPETSEVATPPTSEVNEKTSEVTSEEVAEETEESIYQKCLAKQPPLKDVLAFTTIPEIYKVGQEDRIKIKWVNNDNQNMEFHAFDLDNNGKLDYVEWTVPHLSEQIFEIIFISKAFLLDADRNIIEDIYDQVSQKEGTWADGAYVTVIADNYVRVTFEQVLDNTKDITIYMRPTPGAPNSRIEVFPVYTDANGNQTQGPMLELVSDGQNPDFSNIDHDGKYRILLKNLQTPTDMFDLKIVNK